MWVYLLFLFSILILTLLCCFVPTSHIRSERFTYSRIPTTFSGIPNIIHQTYKKKSKIPKKVYDNVKSFAPEYEHRIYDDAECETFIATHFPDNVLHTFRSLKLGAHKADLFRYCVLYVHGGIYLDIKTELISPLSQIIQTDASFTYLVLNFQKDHIYNGIIATPAQNDIFLKLIDFIVRTGNPPIYHLFCIDFYNQLKSDLQIPQIKPGLSKSYYIFEERCSRNARQCCDHKLDRYGLCCHVYNKNVRIFKTRYSDYPW